ncbi:hypothetical protein [Ascidiimonas sp. W6]|uniref:hypothetical protein n=1 Tax=Ascidiimonas meishanensis TaxID=3128903 RepID=UPI0030EEEA8F
MKKKKISSKLNLNKKSISNLSNQIVGGGWSDGCTDGCTPAQSYGNCTNANCSNDCTGGASWHELCTQQTEDQFMP